MRIIQTQLCWNFEEQSSTSTPAVERVPEQR
jgi:hypothetical protein